MDDDKSIEEILDTIGDQHARKVLAAISRESRSAKELAAECDLSLPTVYRRLEMLQEYDLIGAHGPDFERQYGVLEAEVEPAFSLSTRRDYGSTRLV